MIPNTQKGPQLAITDDIECIILAGGLGTRLRSAVPELPKCMAPVAGVPFVKHLIDYLLKQGVRHFIFALGYKHDIITSYLDKDFPNLQYRTVIEKEPLGTGGAILLACKAAFQKNVNVVNGDTLFQVNIPELISFHLQHQSNCTLCLKPMKEFNRYGVVEINQNNFIQSFKEKKYYSSGLINGGVYALQLDSFMHLPFPEKFSFEKEYLETYYQSEKMMGLIQDEYFIDIGIPEDFERASQELK